MYVKDDFALPTLCIWKCPVPLLSVWFIPPSLSVDKKLRTLCIALDTWVFVLVWGKIAVLVCDIVTIPFPFPE